ncbi:MAG: urease accessory protein UreD [Solirubrobacteraceae bacterium]|nr:urease accessory protein UreD [Patulibacter sp.]
MNGGVVIRTELGDDGRTRVVELTASAPFAAKLVGDTVHLIGAAAAPLDGDRIVFDLDLAAGTCLTVRSVAATMAWPGRPDAPPSTMDIRARVGDHAVLRWLPEPIVPVRGCRHELRTHVELARTARLVWREEFVLGRANEDPGTLDAYMRVERAGQAVLHQHLAIDGSGAGAHRGAALLGGARATGSLLVVGPGAPEHCATVGEPELRGAVLELEAGGRLASATSTSAAILRRWMDDRERGLTDAPDWVAAPSLPGPTHPDPEGAAR